MKASDDPVREALDVNVDLAVDLRTPRGKIRPIFNEPINGLFAKLSHEVDCGLQIEIFLHHDNNDHVVGVA